MSDDLAAWLEEDPARWLGGLFPRLFSRRFAAHHDELWRWVWSVERGRRPRPFVAVWPRGGAKSTSAEAATAAVGARGVRSYGLYVKAVQEHADDHVQNVGAMLESPEFGAAYPGMADRMVGKYGSSRGWRRNRLRTRSGFTVDAVGLDAAARGVKLEDQRPDWLVLDDLDDELDSPAAVAKKIKMVTRKLLPAGTDDLAVLAIQNVVHEHSVFARLCGIADEPADFLTDRIVSGPVPALLDLVLTDDGLGLAAGVPTWPEGMSLDDCREIVKSEGVSAFLAERQHDVEPSKDGLFGRLDFEALRVYPGELPVMARLTVWCDPAVTNTDRSDCQGIQADGLGEDGLIYRLRSWEGREDPNTILERAIRWAVELRADRVGVETDQGGDLWRGAFEACLERVLVEDYDRTSAARPTELPAFAQEKAGGGDGPKAHRASLMRAAYERGVFRHLRGPHVVLERALKRFGIRKPFDLCDSAYWSWKCLAGGEVGPVVRVVRDLRAPVFRGAPGAARVSGGGRR